MRLAALVLVALVTGFVPAPRAHTRPPAADPLPSWNDTAPKEAITAFVAKVTKEGSPEFKFAGRAAVLEDEDLRTKLGDLYWEMIEWRPAPDSHYFEFLAERAAWVTYDGKGQTRVIWKLGQDGEKRLYKPGI